MKYKLLIVWLSFKEIFRMNIGDLVWYKEKQHRILDGVRSGSWRLSDLDNGDGGWVDRIDCRKVWTLSNISGSFSFRYNFYMNYWYEIWKQSGIKPWMKGCDIW